MEKSTKAMTTKGKAFRKRNWWLLGDDELAEYERKWKCALAAGTTSQRNF